MSAASARSQRGAPAPRELTVEVLSSLAALEAHAWNHLAGSDNPFVSYEFLVALERNGCVGEAGGWIPHHLALRDGETLVGAVPMYVKTHSYGEFVFDWGWAEAYERAGLQYYPKLVAAVPYTPVTGPRLLRGPEADAHAFNEVLTRASLAVAHQSGVSSLHWLFPEETHAPFSTDGDLLERTGCQFHWHNPGYRDFQDFLDTLSSKRRKQIRRERREAQAASVEVEVLAGSEVSPTQWEAYHQLYASTYDRKWGQPSLSTRFFVEIGRTLGDAVLLVLARRDGRYVAGAHLLVGKRRLYGRNWGCTEFHASLHFEMCYYVGIDYCIANALEGFEAGAQGEHKIYRGFMPVKTRSTHWIKHPQFRDAIADFLVHERRSIDAYIEDMRTHSPFKDRALRDCSNGIARS